MHHHSRFARSITRRPTFPPTPSTRRSVNVNAQGLVRGGAISHCLCNAHTATGASTHTIVTLSAHDNHLVLRAKRTSHTNTCAHIGKDRCACRWWVCDVCIVRVSAGMVCMCRRVLYLSLCAAAVNAGDDRLSVSRNKKGEQFLASWCLGQISVLTIVRHDIRN